MALPKYFREYKKAYSRHFLPILFNSYLLFTSFISISCNEIPPSTLLDFTNRVRPRFFDQVGHETSEINIFSLNHVIARLAKIMNNLLKHVKI